MSFLVLLTEDDPDAWDRATEAEREIVMDAHRAFDKAVRERGKMLGGEAIAGTETARTLRTVGGVRQVVDGPYAETVEQLGGFYVIDVDRHGRRARTVPDPPRRATRSRSVR